MNCGTGNACQTASALPTCADADRGRGAGEVVLRRQEAAGCSHRPEARVALSQEMARRTCLLLAGAGARPLVLAADTEVARWAKALAWRS